MQQLGQRIKQLRKEQGLSQSDLANKIGLSYAQVGRYETKGTQPSAEAIKKIAEVFGISPDFLINGSANDKANSTLSDIELIQQFKAVESLNEEDKSVIKKLIEAFLIKKELQQKFAS